MNTTIVTYAVNSESAHFYSVYSPKKAFFMNKNRERTYIK